MDKENSTITKTPHHQYYEFKNCAFKKNIEYPLLFKIKDIATPFMHFATDKNLKYLNLKGIVSLDTSER